MPLRQGYTYRYTSWWLLALSPLWYAPPIEAYATITFITGDRSATRATMGLEEIGIIAMEIVNSHGVAIAMA